MWVLGKKLESALSSNLRYTSIFQGGKMCKMYLIFEVIQYIIIHAWNFGHQGTEEQDMKVSSLYTS
jgi:hypothetical protein